MPLFMVFLDGEVKEICLQCRRHGFNPCVGKIPWRRKWQPTPIFLPEKSHGQRSLGGGATVHGVTKLDTTERLCTYTYTCTAPLAGAPGSLPPPGSLPRSLLLPSHLTFRWPLSVSLGCSTQWSLKNATNSM